MDFSKVLIRCSAIGKIMTEPKEKAARERGELSATCKSYLQELYIEQKYNRRREYSSKYIEKGKEQEEAGITLYSLYKRNFMKKNTTRLYNEFLTGEPDLFLGEQLEGCEEGADIKCSWDLHTFPMFETKLNKDYEYQDHGYMALTGAKRWTTVYTLVNCSASQIDREKMSLFYALGMPPDNDPTYIEKRQEIERNMIYDMAQFKKDYPGYDLDTTDWRFDIPRNERVKEFVVERDEAVIEAIYEQVKRCRAYMQATFGSHLILIQRDEEVKATIVEKVNIHP